MYESPDQLPMNLRGGGGGANDHHDDDHTPTKPDVNGWPMEEPKSIHCQPELVHLISCEHPCAAAPQTAETPVMNEVIIPQTPTAPSSYGIHQPPPSKSNSKIVSSGLVTGRVNGDFDPYPPSSADVPTDVPAYHNENSPMLNGTDREDEPLLDLESTGTDVDHCHAASASKEPDTSSNRRAQRQLMFAAIVCFLFMVGELVGGVISGSLAIMTDAAHLLSDFTSFLISLFALWIARRPPTSKMSFGYFRAEILGAVISVLMIWIATGILVYLAIQRCITLDFTIDAKVMLITASCGLGVNILLAVVLHFTGHTHSHGGIGHGHSHGDSSHDDKEEETHSHGNSGNSCNNCKTVDNGDQEQPLSIQSDRLMLVMDVDAPEAEATVAHRPHKPKKEQGNMNVRAAFIHILGDLIQSVGVCIAAVVIMVKPDWKIADPICTFVFSVLVLITTILILRDALQVLMEGVPRHINLQDLRADLKSVHHVRMAHGLHVWSLTTNQAAIAVHLCIDAGEDAEGVLQEASQLVRKKYNITFSTIQVEHYQPEVMNNCGRCQEPNR